MPKRIEKRTKKRIQVPLSPEVHAVISDLSEVMGIGTGGVCEQMLTEAAPAMKELSASLKKLRMGSAGGAAMNVRGLVNELEQLVGDARQTTLDLEQKLK